MPQAPAHTTQSTPDSFKLEQFGGMLPAWNDHLIPTGQAASSLNGYLFSGALQGWREPKLLHTLQNSAAKFAYRLPRQTQNIANATIYVPNKPVDGDTVTLGEEVYTFRDVVEAAYDVFIGASVTTAVTHLFQAFTIDNGNSTNVGTNYGTGTVANPAINQTSPITTNILATDTPRIEVFAPTSGAAYNTTLVAATGSTGLQWKYGSTPTTSFQGGTNLAFDASVTGPSTWLEFVDPDTDVMRSPVVDDSYDRFYFACPSIAPEYNTRARLEAGQSNWLLGVPAPGCTPGVEVSGGGSSVTLGFETSVTSTTGDPGANVIYLVPVTPDGAMILNDINVMPAGTSTTARWSAMLYSDLNGSPHELMNTGTIVTGLTAGVQSASAFVNPTGLLMNVQYWIGYAIDSAVEMQMANDTGSSGVVGLNSFSNGPPAILNNLSVGFGEIQMWADLTSSAVQDARSYVYTYVSEYDEESAPSPATVVSGWSNGTWTISLFQPPPDQLGITRNLTQIRLYRSITALAGATTYFHVADMPITTATYSDIITDDVVVTNYQLQSQLWTPPPTDLQGIIAMPNGMAVGFRANEIWFSEPYRPHAWPASYVLTTEYPIVGLGVTGSTVVACTSGSPYIATGTSPGTMSALKIQTSEPCHSRGSILGNNDGVYYASRNGLILVTQYGSVSNTSELWITREKWQQLTSQKNLRAVFLVSSYFALGTVRTSDTSEAQRGFTIELNANDAQSFSIWPQPGGHRLGFQLLSGPNGYDVDNVGLDPWSSVCLVVQNGGVYYYDFSDEAPTMQTYVWRSKLFQQKSKKNFEAMRIWFTIPEGTPALNATRMEEDTDDPIWNSLPADRYGIVRVYAGNGQLVTTREIRVPQEILRITSGYKHETWQWEIEARVPISNIQIGTSVKALAQT
jgi:hypothetical protein